MFSKVNSAGLRGVEGYPVQVEADVSNGLPGFYMVGYLASEVREAEERVRTALKNSGFQLPPKRITVNLSPADIHKDGTAYDLPIAVSVLAGYGVVASEILRGSAFVGELGLDGTVKPVRGVLPLVLALRDAGWTRCFLPAENAAEGLAVEQMEIVKAENLRQVAELLLSPDRIRPEKRRPPKDGGGSSDPVDFSEVSGQKLLRRATEVAAAGQHNILYLGPPGSGKSMIARRIPTIMPSLSAEEQLEISKVYSVCGMLPPGKALMESRPFRSPHHTASTQAMTGGGRRPRPGELSLANRGVLFLDELAEFRRETLEILRQPLEEQKIVVSRVYGQYEFPANVLLAAAMNPCPCGYYPDRERCQCTEQQVRRYLGKISRPLLDRIDICVEASPVSYQELRSEEENESSAAIRERVEKAREIQRERFSGTEVFFNSQMGSRQVKRFCSLGEEEEDLLQKAFQSRRLTPRGCQRILKVARTIADLDGEERIRRAHLSEAVSYRDLEEKYWGKEA